MKKTIGIIGTLLATVFVGFFAAARIHRHWQGKTVTPKVVSAPVQPSTTKLTKEAPKAVFYTSVGGSVSTDSEKARSSRVSTRYTIELGTLTSQKEAEALLIQLKSKGIDGFYTPTRRSGAVLYHVRLGLYANPDDAEQNLKKISLRTNITGRVTKLN